MEEETTPIQDIIYIIKKRWVEAIAGLLGGLLVIFLGYKQLDDPLWPFSLLWK